MKSPHRSLLADARGASVAAALVCLAGCASGDKPAKARVPQHLALVANWLEGSLSYVDMDKVRAGATTREDVVAFDVPMEDCTPGPFDVVLSPDGQTALLSCSTGWFGSPALSFLVDDTFPTVAGQLILFDVAQQRVRARLDGGFAPTSAAFTPDGSRAVVVNFGTLTAGDGELVVVDVAGGAIVDRMPAGRLAEEIAFDDTGTAAIYGFSDSGSLRTFAVADPRGSLSDEIQLVGGSAGVAFFPGTKVAFAIQLANPLSAFSGGSARGGYSLIDVSNPSEPVVLADERDDDNAIGYPVIPAPSRGTVLVPVTVSARLVLREYALEGQAARLVDSLDIGDANLLSAVGVAFDGNSTVLIGWPAERSLVAVDLEQGTSTIIPWQDRAGPTEIAVRDVTSAR